MTTGQLISQAREAKGMTQRALADASGVPLRTLEKIEQGIIPDPKLITVARIAKPLGMTCSDFIPDLPAAEPETAKPMGKRK